MRDLELIAQRRAGGTHFFSCRLPIDPTGAGGHLHRPAHFLRGTGRQRDGLRGQLNGLATFRSADQRRLHAECALRGVAQREGGIQPVAFTRQRRQARQHLQVLRHAHAGAAAAEAISPRIGNGHQAKTGERIVQRHGDAGFAFVVELHRAAPQQQGVEQLACGVAAAATAGRQGFAAVMPPADDFALRCGRFNTPGPRLKEPVQQVPTAIGL